MFLRVFCVESTFSPMRFVLSTGVHRQAKGWIQSLPLPPGSCPSRLLRTRADRRRAGRVLVAAFQGAAYLRWLRACLDRSHNLPCHVVACHTSQGCCLVAFKRQLPQLFMCIVSPQLRRRIYGLRKLIESIRRLLQHQEVVPILRGFIEPSTMLWCGFAEISGSIAFFY